MGLARASSGSSSSARGECQAPRALQAGPPRRGVEGGHERRDPPCRPCGARARPRAGAVGPAQARPKPLGPAEAKEP